MLSSARRSFPALFLAGLGSVGCGGGGSVVSTDAAATPAPTPRPLVFLDGAWRGTTAQGLPITFTVQDARVVSLGVDWNGQGTAGPCSHSSSHTMNVQIFGGGTTLPRFNHVQPDVPSFEGTFTTATAASGSLVVTQTTPVACSSGTVAWTASK